MTSLLQSWGLLFLGACHSSVRLQASPDDPHALLVEADPSATVVCSSPDDTRTLLPGETVLRGLLADTTYTCQADSPDATDEARWQTEPLPDDLPVPTLTIPNNGAGWHIFNVSDFGSDPYLLLIDSRGRVRWRFPGVGTGDIDTTYLGGAVLMGGKNVRPQIIDLDGAVLWEATEALGSPYEVAGSWNHDTGLSQDGSSIFGLCDESVTIDGVTTTGFVIKQYAREDGALLWSWSSTVDGAGLPLGEGEDPYHANAIWDIDGALIVSLRNVDMIIKIDRATKQIVWRLGAGGDFQLLEADGSPAGDDRWFVRQHDAKLVDGTLYLYANRQVPTRAMALTLDEDARTARIDQEWSLAPEWHGVIWGGVDPRPGGGFSVAYGNWDSPEQPPSALYHIDAAGELIWEVDMPPETWLYRSEQIAAFP